MTSQLDDAEYRIMSVDGEETMSEHEGDSGVESTNSADSMLYIRIAVSDLNIQVSLCFMCALW